ncbi:MAG: hypothetical protein R2831_12945 [Chitinophagaceae bacterium]
MKTIITTFLFVLSFCTNSIHAQKNNLQNQEIPIVWLGIDYSHVKFIGSATGWGDESTKTEIEIRDKYFREWNDLLIDKAEYFKLEEAVNRKTVERNTEMVRKINANAEYKNIFSESNEDYQLLDKETVLKFIKKYNFPKKDAIGFLLVAEGMSKPLKEGSYWAVFIDLKSKEVLAIHRIDGKASGFGFKNYWAGTIKSVFKSMIKSFKHW